MPKPSTWMRSLEMLQSHYSKVQVRHVTIDYYPCGPSCKVMANGLVRTYSSNLVWNSIKHSDANKPSVYITLGLKRLRHRWKNYYQVTVEDNGPGIPDELKEKLFTGSSGGIRKPAAKALGYTSSKRSSKTSTAGYGPRTASWATIRRAAGSWSCCRRTRSDKFCEPLIFRDY